MQQRRLRGARDAQHAATHAPTARPAKRLLRVEGRRRVAEQAHELGRFDEEVGARAEEHGQKVRERVVHDALARLARSVRRHGLAGALGAAGRWRALPHSAVAALAARRGGVVCRVTSGVFFCNKKAR